MSHSTLRIRLGHILLIAVVFYLGLTAAYTALVVKYEKTELVTGLDLNLLKTARSVPLMLAPDFFERAVRPDAIPEEEDLENIDNLTQLADSLGLAYLYTLTEVDGTVYITSSSASKKERQSHTEVRTFTAYPEVQEAVRKAISSDEPAFSTYTDRWGTFRSAYIPLRNTQGVPYVIAAEQSSDYVASLLNQHIIHTIATPFFFILAALPFLVAYQMQVHKNTAHLQLLNRELSENKERFEIATEAGRIGVWDRDILNDQLVWDDRMFELYGIQPDDFSGAQTAWQNGLHPDDRDRAAVEVTAAENDKKPFNTEFRIVRPDGETRHIRAFGKVIRSKDGTPLRMIGTNQDITSLKRTEEELLSSNAFLDSVIDQSPFPMFTTDLHGTIIRTNQAMCSTLDLKSNDLVGHYNIFKNENLNQPGITEKVKKVFERHETAHYTTCWKTGLPGSPVGSRRRDLNISVSMIPILNPAGELTHVICQWLDITASKRAEDTLQERNEELERFNKAAVGRELRMIELKKEINTLCRKSGTPEIYP